MKTEPFFSIITITKNNLSGLQSTAESILCQSTQNYEWIIVDGLSNDGTQDYASTLPAEYICEPDNGIYHAMNKGLARARGRYVCFMNAGDRFADMDILSTLEGIAKAFNPEFIYGDALETSGFYKKARPSDHLTRGMFTHHQSMLYRRDKIGSLQYDETLKIASDYGFTAAFIKECMTSHYFPGAICVFENGGVSEKNRELGRREQFEIRRRLGVGVIENSWIYGLQTLCAKLREKAPNLYYFSRRISSRPILIASCRTSSFFSVRKYR